MAHITLQDYGDDAKKHPDVFMGVLMDLVSNRETDPFCKYAPPDLKLDYLKLEDLKLKDMKPENISEEKIARVEEIIKKYSEKRERGKHNIVHFSCNGNSATIAFDYLSAKPRESGGVELEYEVLDKKNGILKRKRIIGAWND